MNIKPNKTEKRSYNKPYKQVKIYVKPEIAEAFKTKCLNEGVSLSEKLSGLMEGETIRISAIDAVEQKGQRRKAVGIITGKLEKIIEAEIEYIENLPDNLQNSSLRDKAEEIIETLEEALSLLEQVYS